MHSWYSSFQVFSINLLVLEKRCVPLVSFLEKIGFVRNLELDIIGSKEDFIHKLKNLTAEGIVWTSKEEFKKSRIAQYRGYVTPYDFRITEKTSGRYDSAVAKGKFTKDKKLNVKFVAGYGSSFLYLLVLTSITTILVFSWTRSFFELNTGYPNIFCSMLSLFVIFLSILFQRYMLVSLYQNLKKDLEKINVENATQHTT